MHSKKLILSFLCLAFILPSVLFLFGTVRSESNEFQKKKKPKNWLDGPVRYIITREEEKQYKKCNTEEEKARFIKWFWVRRGTNPKSYKNKFQREFEHRVEYAITNFKEREINGWKTARGHVYIVLGPPSRVERRILSRKERKMMYLYPTKEIRSILCYFWWYENPPTRHLYEILYKIQPLIFTDLYKDGRWFLIRPIPKDNFEYHSRKNRPKQSYFELVPDEYIRAFEEVNESAIQNPGLKIGEVEVEEVREDIAAIEEIPFQWKVDFFPAPNNKIELKITITVQYKEIPYYQEDEKYQAMLELSVKLFKETEQLAAELKDEIPIKLTEEELMAKVEENLEYMGSLIADPGEYNIEIILQDSKFGCSKTINQKLTIARKSE